MNTNTLNDRQYSDQNDINVIDNYNKVSYAVDPGEYDYVLSFFARSMKDKDAAKNFTTSMYQVSRTSGTPIIEIIKSMEGLDGLEMSATLAYYLNGTRSNTSMVGITNIIQPNHYAGRSVLS